MYDVVLHNDPFSSYGTTVMLPHAPKDADKIVRLRESMSRDGWLGRAIIVMESENGAWRALNGTHRLCAAMDLPELAVPVVYLPADLTEADWDEIDMASDDDDLLKVFQEIGETRDDMAEVIDTMRAEIEANNA